MRRGRLALIAAAAAWLAAATPAAAQTALDLAVRDLCHRDVAMLGEATHGDGATTAFKVALVQRLVDRCGFRAVLFEASHYESIDVQRRIRLGLPVTRAMVSGAMDAKWNFDVEFQPLIDFVFRRVVAKRVMLGGIDDQIGGRGNPYANDQMPIELTEALPEPRRTECRDWLKRRMYWRFGSDYTPAIRLTLVQCVADATRAVASGSTDPATKAEQLEMLAAIARQLDRDHSSGSANFAGRDRSMYLNFRWLAERLPPRSKIIVWSATAHIAKVAQVDGKPDAPTNFGTYVHRDYGDRAFALGFAALSGNFRWSKQEPARPIAPAAPGSLEALAMAGVTGDATYVDRARLQRFGAVPGRLSFYTPVTLDWSKALDGLIVFRRQYPPPRIDEKPPT